MVRTMQRRFRLLAAALAIALPGLAAPVWAAEPAQKHPDVIAVKVRASGPDRFDFAVTISSPYDLPERYADAFRVIGKDGTVYGERELLHDHAAEQPFTRDLYAVKVPRAVQVVVVQGRDRRYGYGGKSVEVTLPGR
jgi:hypothetical protein